MITEQRLRDAQKKHDDAEEIIHQYYREKEDAFTQRLKSNPVFTDDELFYSAIARCPCGHGLAYPKEASPHHHWDCSAILKGVADRTIQHTAQLPFSMYDIRGEQASRGTTRP